MMAEAVTNLSFRDWDELAMLIVLNSCKLIGNRADSTLFLHLCQFTVMRRRFDADIPISQIQNGFPIAGIIKFGHSPSMIRRLRKNLEESHLVFTETVGRGVRNYRPNLWGLIMAVLPLFTASPKRHILYTLKDKIEQFWTSQGWKLTLIGEDDEMKKKSIEEMIDQGRNLTKLHRDREEEKLLRASAAALRGTPNTSFKWKWVQQAFQAACTMDDIEYTEQWTGKLQGQAKRWLADISRQGEDCRALVRLIVQNWGFMRTELTTDFGAVITLYKNPNFEQTYRWRKPIMDWLSRFGEEKPSRAIVSNVLRLTKADER